MKILKFLFAIVFLPLFFQACSSAADPACECFIPWIDSQELLYNIGDVVKHEEECWIVKSPLRADVQEPGTENDSPFWVGCDRSEVFPCECPNEWTPTLNYSAGSIVFFQDRCYIARLSNNDAAPANNAQLWDVCE